MSIWPTGAWETPLGPVRSTRILRAPFGASAEIVEVDAAHGREHSLEMQLPFLAHLMPGVPIVPMVMGHQTARDRVCAWSGAGRCAFSASGKDVLLVASSDLSHYEDARMAERLDGVVMERVAAMDAGRTDARARARAAACLWRRSDGVGARCGGTAGRVSAARVLRYADSGDVSGDKSSVVGYMAAAVW